MILDSYRQVIEKHFHHGEIHSSTPINVGWSSFVVDINGDYIFRFPRREEIRQAQAKEIRLLPELGKALGYRAALSLQVPVFEYILTADNLLECAVGYKKILGVPLTKGLIDSPEIPGQLGKFLTDLHRFPVEFARQLGVPGVNGVGEATTADWIKKYEKLYAWVKENAFPLLTDSVCARWVRIWEDFLCDSANFRYQPVLIHGDLAGEHILCDPELKTVTGIIDWEDACIGDLAMDFVDLFKVGGRDFIEKVLQYYENELGDNFWSRILFYAGIAPFYEVQYGLLTGGTSEGVPSAEFHLQHGLAMLALPVIGKSN